MLSGIMYNHERKIYNFITLIGDLGGVREIFTALIAFFIMPMSTFSFNLMAFQKLYQAKSINGSKIFMEETCDENQFLPAEYKDTEV